MREVLRGRSRVSYSSRYFLKSLRSCIVRAVILPGYALGVEAIQTRKDLDGF